MPPAQRPCAAGFCSAHAGRPGEESAKRYDGCFWIQSGLPDPQCPIIGCDVASTNTLNRDRIAATIFTVGAHALVIATLWFSGSGTGARSVPDAALGDGQDTTVAARFLARQKQASPKPPPPPVVETTPQPPPVEDSSIPEPAPAEESVITQQSNPAASPANETEGGAGAPADELGARYLAAVRAAIVREWNAQGGGEIPSGCAVVFDQVDGGRPLRAWVMHCGSLSAIERARLETAVMQAQPLPYAGFEPVFQTHLKLTF